MQFIQTGMLAALGGLAIPLIIHLMFRQRARPIDLGTLQFLKVVLRDNARRRRLRRRLLLALRLACIALIALTFARPYLLATEPVEGDRLVVVLFDRSASMGLRGGTRPIDRAIAEGRAIVARAGRGTQLELAAFDTAVRPFKATDDWAKVLEPSSGGTDYGTAMAWARDLCVRSARRTKEVHVLTDLQRSGLDRGESATMPARVAVRLVDLGRAFPRNVAVTNLAVTPRTVRPGEPANVTARAFNASPLPARKVRVGLRLEAGGKVLTPSRTIDLDGGASHDVAIALPPLVEGTWRGHVEATTGDDLPFDDRRYLAIAVAPPVRVLLVDGDPGRTPFEAETYFLEAALRLAPAGARSSKSPFEPRSTARTHGEGLADLAKADVVVLANVGGLGREDAGRLAAFVARGGGLVVFTGDHVRPEDVRTLESVDLGVGEMIGIATSAESPWRLEAWDAAHPVFRPFLDPEHGDLHRPAFATITRFRPDPLAKVLARFRGDLPALLENTRSRGKVLWFASACDRGWGNWPRGRLFLPMVHQVLGYAAGLSEGGKVRQELAGEGHAPGVFEADGIDHVVNADPFESETARCTEREFAARFGFRPAGAERAEPSPGAPRSSPDDRVRGDEIWPWLALALVGGLLLENFLANRTAA